MNNLEIDNAYVGTDPVEKIYLGSELIYEPTPPAPSYIEFNEWYQQGSNRRTLGNVLLIKQNSIIWSVIGEVGYLADSGTTNTGSSHYVIQITRSTPAQMPLMYHNTGTTTFSPLFPNSTETIDGVTYDRYDLPVNVYLAGDSYNLWNSAVPTGNLYIIPQN